MGVGFANDQIPTKVRWEFGGGRVDYRGAYWSQVAGWGLAGKRVNTNLAAG
jgi:hypothetical protein